MNMSIRNLYENLKSKVPNCPDVLLVERLGTRVDMHDYHAYEVQGGGVECLGTRALACEGCQVRVASWEVIIDARLIAAIDLADSSNGKIVLRLPEGDGSVRFVPNPIIRD